MSIFKERETTDKPVEDPEDKNEKKIDTTFRERLEKIIIDRGIKKRALAEKIGMAPNTLSGYLNGKHLPDIFTLIRICDTLNISTDYLLGRTDNPNVDNNRTPNENEMLSYYRLISKKSQHELLGEARGILRIENSYKNK